MRHYIFLLSLLALPVLCFAQYPNFPSKITLGLQTTGDGLIYRGTGAPAYTPANNRNAWVYLDTVASSLYVFTGGVWKTTGGGADSTLASNGLTLSGKTVKLGGSLTESTNISGGAFGLGISTTDASTPGLTITSPYTGLQASSTNGSTALYGITSNSTTTTVLNTLSLLRNTSGTAGNGIGQSIALAQETTNGISYTGNEIKSLWSNATTASRTSRFIITGVNSGTLADKFTIEGSGQIKLNAYGTNNQIGTGWGRLVAQADGVIAVDTTTIGSSGTTDLTFSGASSPVTLNSSTGTDVTFTAGTGISLAATSGNTTITNSAPDQTVSITGAGINVASGTYPNFTITGTEVDGSISNEGSLTVGAGTGTTSIINSNTSGSTGVTLSVAGTGIAISEAGNTITLTGSALTAEVDGSITNEGYTGVTAGGATSSVLQGYNSAGTATGAGTTINVSGGGLAISESTSTNGGSITISSTALTAEVDGSITNEGVLGVTAGAANTSVLQGYNASGTTTGNGVTITAGTGISIAESTSTNGGTITLTNSAPDQTVSLTGAGINVTSGTYPNFTITGTEVDGSVSNEGSLTVGAGTGTTSTIVSNTSGSTPVTIEAGAGMAISESGSTITLASNAEYIKSATIESPTATENITLFYTRKAITIREVSDVVRGTSPSVTWQIQYAATRNSGSPTNLFSASRTTTSASGATTTTFNDATIAAGNWIWFTSSATSGTNNELSLSITYTID